MKGPGPPFSPLPSTPVPRASLHTPGGSWGSALSPRSAQRPRPQSPGGSSVTSPACSRPFSGRSTGHGGHSEDLARSQSPPHPP
uniref:Uncharacterized protein n=1 Tax=Rangifer tarandus platyrhynchus TaxID=3082113 RepID=A0ACB0FAM3_RANTA|nr:unnamed protein product [Rangifer tarandus platyrhynchus]